MAGSYPLPVTTNGVHGGPKLRGGARNLMCDLVPGVEVLSCWVGGGRASVVGPGKTVLTCRTPQGRKIKGNSLSRISKGRSGRAALAANGMELRASNRRVGKTSTSGALAALKLVHSR